MSGSEYGKPTSKASAPASARAANIDTEPSRSGSPAIMKGSSAVRPSARVRTKRRRNRVAPVESVPMTSDLLHVFVASAGEAQQHLLAGQLLSLPGDPRHGMGRFEGGDDSFGSSKQLHAPQGFLVGDRNLSCQSSRGEVGVLRTHPRVVETRRDRVGLHHLAFFF